MASPMITPVTYARNCQPSEVQLAQEFDMLVFNNESAPTHRWGVDAVSACKSVLFARSSIALCMLAESHPGL
jgi:hypothetical protein